MYAKSTFSFVCPQGGAGSEEGEADSGGEEVCGSHHHHTQVQDRAGESHIALWPFTSQSTSPTAWLCGMHVKDGAKTNWFFIAESV